jgi:hypothetical protein
MSPAGYFSLYMQGDGNLCVYRLDGVCLGDTAKTGPAGDYCAVLEPGGLLNIFSSAAPPAPGTNPFFTSKNTGSNSAYYAILQDDGNFCIYPGTDPDNQQSDHPIYAFNCWDPVVEVVVTDIEYDLKNATITNNQVLSLVEQTLKNSTTLNQSSIFTGSGSVTNSRMWQNSTTLTAKVTASTEFQAKVPVAASKNKIEVSIEVSDTLTFNHSTSETDAYSWSQPVVVPPASSVVATASVSKAQINAPFELTATIHYQSGAQYTGQFPGMYTGGSSYDLKFKFSSPQKLSNTAVAAT